MKYLIVTIFTICLQITVYSQCSQSVSGHNNLINPGAGIGQGFKSSCNGLATSIHYRTGDPYPSSLVTLNLVDQNCNIIWSVNNISTGSNQNETVDLSLGNGTTRNIIAGNQYYFTIVHSNPSTTHWYKADLQNPYTNGHTVNLDCTDFLVSQDIRFTVSIDQNLPVELVDFKGNVANYYIDLFWETQIEVNNYGFEVEKSTTGKDWKFLEFIKGQGTTTDNNEYKCQDLNPYLGINYYRLKQIDYDGQYNYSDIAIVRYNGNIESSIYPNPATSEVTIKTTASTSLQIMDVYGRVLLNQNIPEGQNTINLSALPTGILIFMLSNQRYKVLKE